MNKNAKKWVKALRSGKYRQGRYLLRDGHNNFCCLGVACDMYAAEHPKHQWQFVEGFGYTFADEQAMLPSIVQKWLGLSTFDGEFHSRAETTSLVEQNDLCKTFRCIADLIESEPKGLFK